VVKKGEQEPPAANGDVETIQKIERHLDGISKLVKSLKKDKQ
jgi:hypothetical protein